MRGRVHERRLPLPALDDVDVRAAVDEELHRSERAGARGQHQRRLTLGQRAVDFGARVEQRSDERGIGDLARFV